MLLELASWRRPLDNPAVPRADAGLCDSCRHQRLVPNTRGSVFSRCERSRTDERFPKYPRLPVRECIGWEQRGAPGPT
jgi:hypothetical protein